MLIINYFVGMIVGSALVYDLYYRKIPNYLVATGYAGLIPYVYVRDGFSGIAQAFAVVCVIGVTLIIMYILGGLGAGDVKLMCLICGFLDIKHALIYTMLVLCIGAFVGLIKIGMKLIRTVGSNAGLTSWQATGIRFGIPITIGYLVLLISKGGII